MTKCIIRMAQTLTAHLKRHYLSGIKLLFAHLIPLIEQCWSVFWRILAVFVLPNEKNIVT